MRVFVTGATGFIGSAVVKELIGSGHEVTGLARTESAAKSLVSAGAKIHRGSLEDLESLRKGAAASEGVIHTAFIHDIAHTSPSARLQILARSFRLGIGMSFMTSVIETELRAIKALGDGLAETGHPLVVAAGTLGVKTGELATELDDYDPTLPSRRLGEEATLALVSRGVRATVLRLPPSVHDLNKQGLVTYLIDIARKKHVSAYVGDGQNRWPAVHVLDTARLFRLILEKGTAGSRWHGVAEEGVPFKDIAEMIGRQLNVPTSSKEADHFGFLKLFTAMDSPASSKITQDFFGWSPTERSLLADLEQGISPRR